MALEGENVRRAAALALQSHAISIVTGVGPVRSLLDLQLDANAPAESLMALARELRSGSGGKSLVSMWASEWEYSEDFPDGEV